MLGNLQVFAGREALNSYAEKLQHLGPLLWVARGGLLLIVLVHIVLAVRLALENRAARPERYAHPGRLQSTPSARSMVITGLIILLFVAYHLAHFTLGLTNPDQYAVVDAAGRHDVYGMVVAGFSMPLVTGLYVAAMALLCLHLSHGFQSIFQTWGVSNPKAVPAIRRTSIALAWIIFVGNASMPLAVLAGLVPLHPGG
jgi:succinate dehydrogenase / fumarate reductase cytochrome b subunit